MAIIYEFNYCKNTYKACYCPAFAPEAVFTEAVSLAASLGGFRLRNQTVGSQKQGLGQVRVYLRLKCSSVAGPFPTRV